jgi:cysteine synthase
VLKRHRSEVRVAVVEPAESSVLLGGAPGPHKIEGVGIGYQRPLWEPSLVDEIIPIATGDTRRWSGAEATVVTLLPDSGLKYLATDVYRR